MVSRYDVLIFLVDNLNNLYTTFLCNSLSIEFASFLVMYSIKGIVAVVISKDGLLRTSRCRDIAFSTILIDD